MKAIRRSLKGDKDPRPHHQSHHHSPHLSLTPKSAIAILPPKKVIKALYDHHPDPDNPQELSFCKGDFFHVISREDDSDWYEACNPLIPSARGLVPVSFFEVIGKTGRDSSGSNGNNAVNNHNRGSSLIDLHQHQQSSQSHSHSYSHSHSPSPSHSHSQSLSISHPVQQKEPHDSGFSDRFPSDSAQSPNKSPLHHQNPSLSGSLPRFSTMGKGSGAMVYGLVQYDFKAERPDELEARAGEAIIVIAQSNPEWFVAKPIGRLGGPGLIPVSFLELKDMQTGQPVTDPLDAVRRAGVPKVEEWKKMTAEYKNSSITLGKIDSIGGSNGGGSGGGGGSTMSGVPSMTSSSMDKMSLGGHMSQNGNPFGYHNRNASKGTLSHPHVSHPYPQSYQPPPPAPLMAPVAASIPRYCFDNDKYWYIIEAKMEDGRCWELPRFYHDFYDFQIALLTQFEEEAGNRGKPRTLPFMPGPVTHVTDAISNGRRQNLDEYIKKLLAMPPQIARCPLVRQLFAPRAGDFEIDPSAFGEDARYSTGSHQSSNHEASRTVSRQSSQAHLNTAPAAERASHQRNQQSLSQTHNGPPSMNRQPSSLTQVSTQSSGGGAMKVKVFFQDDLIAIRVPNDINLQQLREKLMDRLKTGDGIILQYKDEPSGTVADLHTDEDLDTAIQRNAKLTLLVGVA